MKKFSLMMRSRNLKDMLISSEILKTLKTDLIMTIEEKLKEAKMLYKDANADQRYVLEQLFPELTESGDERIRKELIAHCENLSEMFHTIDKKEDFVKYQSWINWLEKQHKPIDEEKVQIGARKDVALSIINFLDRNTLSMCLSNMECEDLEDAVVNSNWSKVYDYMKKKLEQQGEQKHSNKIEPKFKVGDWCIDNEDGVIFQIVKVLDNTYTYKTNEGKEYSCTHYSLENNIRLWTIQDAKDGDVLVTIKKQPFIFKNYDVETDYVYAYCGITDLVKDNGFYVNTEDDELWTCCSYDNDIYPATKEQRNTLMKAMVAAGYTFDFEKKELKKIEQKPADKIEPRFRVGDWIVNNNSGSVYQVTEIRDDEYCLWPLYGEIMGYLRIIDVDDEYHPWTIQDAKDGDVLINGSNIFIFHFINYARLMGYCHVNTDDGRFYNDIGKNECFCTIDAVVHPATKEQHDLLFQKMNEAGYAWDAVKKELKKIEQNHTDKIEPKFKVGDKIKLAKEPKYPASEIIAIKNDAYYFDEIVYLPFSRQDKWELVEQNHADKIKSKFKIGDWIVYNRNDSSKEILYIYDIRDGRYYFNDNIHISWGVKECDEKCHLWIIQDAKPGDVLAVDNMIFIYERTLASHIVSYCKLINDVFESTSDARTCCEGNTYVHPVTKEQCNLLFQKMNEAGYEWDADKKELKKIELKFKVGDWITDGIDVYEIKNIDLNELNYNFENGSSSDITLTDNICHLWTIEDAKDGDVLDANGAPFIYKGCFDPNHPNSPVAYCGIDDEGYFCSGTHKFNHRWTDEEVHPAAKEQCEQLEKAMADAGYEWDAEKKELKKIEQTSTWTPSEEQIEAFEHFVRSWGESGSSSPYDNHTKLIYSLLQDLKKLKG